MMSIPPKFKYRDPANVPIRKNGMYRGRAGNSHGPTPKPHRKKSSRRGEQGWGARRRIGLGFIGG